MEGWLPTILGTIAGLLSTSSFVPQVIEGLEGGPHGGDLEADVHRHGVGLRAVDDLRLRDRQPADHRLQHSRASSSAPRSWCSSCAIPAGRRDGAALRNPRRRAPVDPSPARRRLSPCCSTRTAPAETTSSIPRDAAESAGLRYVSDEEPGIRRKKAGKGFAYVSPDGGKVDGRGDPRADPQARDPARLYGCVDLPARRTATSRRPGATPRAASSTATTPRSARSARARSTSTCSNSPRRCRRSATKIAEHMGLRGLPREKVLATVVHLLETTLIRVGNDDYAKQNKSYGLTTLRDPHVKVDGAGAALPVQGQERQDLAPAGQGPPHRQDREGLPGPAGPGAVPVCRRERRAPDVTSADVNAYLKEITGGTSPPRISGPGPGPCSPRMALQEFESFDSEAKAKKNIRAAIERVASRLGNTPTICRKCYVHPEVFTRYLEGAAAAGDQGGGRGGAAREPGRPASPRRRPC